MIKNVVLLLSRLTIESVYALCYWFGNTSFKRLKSIYRTQLYNNILIKSIPRSQFVSYNNIVCLFMSILFIEISIAKIFKNYESSVFLCDLFYNSKKVCDNIWFDSTIYILLILNPRFKLLSYHILVFYCCSFSLFLSWSQKLIQYLKSSRLISKSIIWPWRILWSYQNHEWNCYHDIFLWKNSDKKIF